MPEQGRLEQRLTHLRILHAKNKPEAPTPNATNQSPRFLLRWQKQSSHLWKRRVELPAIWEPSFDATIFFPLGHRRLLPKKQQLKREPLPVASSQLRFFDLETTGLSGGAGTVAFCATIGKIQGQSLVLEQLFMNDFPGEPAFIAAIIECLGSDTVLVSYNGKAFDYPLLQSRCIMHRQALPPYTLHLDLLHICRRLWRTTLGSARLSVIESHLLGTSRQADIPSAKIPEIWLASLKSGDHPLLEKIAQHNLEDVLSLIHIKQKLIHMCEHPLDIADDLDCDVFGLARTLRGQGKLDLAFRLLADHAQPPSNHVLSPQASVLYLQLARDLGEHSAYEAHLGILPDDYYWNLVRSRFYEKTKKDDASALMWAKKALNAQIDRGLQHKVEARIKRLGKKISLRK